MAEPLIHLVLFFKQPWSQNKNLFEPEGNVNSHAHPARAVEAQRGFQDAVVMVLGSIEQYDQRPLDDSAEEPGDNYNGSLINDGRLSLVTV